MSKTSLVRCLACVLSLMGGALQAQTTNNLQLWLKPEALTNTIAASPIAFWADSATGGYHATNPAAGRQPTYSASALNGYPVAHFTGDGVGAANNYLQSPLPYNASTNPFSVVIVYNPDFVGTRAQLVHQIGGYAMLYLQPNSSPSKTNLISNASGQIITNSLANTKSWKIVTLVEDATTIKMYENGVLVGSTALTLPATATSGGGYVFGARQNKTAFGYNGDLAEVLVYNSALSTAEQAATESYLATKYNLSQVILADSFNTLSDPGGINDDLAVRQTGLVAPTTYFSGGGPVNVVGGAVYLDNSSPSGSYDFVYATSTLNILPYEAGATLNLSFDITNFNAACINNGNDSWVSCTLSQYTTPGGPVTDWGMLIRTNGSGAVFGSPGGSISVTPTNNYHVDMTIVSGTVHLWINGADQGLSTILCPLTYAQSFLSFGLGSVNNGADTVSFDNLLIKQTLTPAAALPSTLKLADNFNSADSANLNANLSRQTGSAAPVTWLTNGNLNAAAVISANTLLLTNSPAGGVSIGMASPSVDFRQLEHLNSFKINFTVAGANDATSNDSWIGFRFRDNAPSHFVADADGGGTGINFFPGDGRWYFWQSYLGATNVSAIVTSGTATVSTNYAFEFEVRTNVLRLKINGVPQVLGCGDGSYNLPAYQAANFVTLHCYAGNPATAAYAAFDNFTFASLDPGFTVASPILLNPAYANPNFKFSVNSGNTTFYAVDAKSTLTAATWNYLGGFVGTGGLVTYTNSTATNNPQFYRLRVP